MQPSAGHFGAAAHRRSRGQAPQFAEPLRDIGFSPLRWWDVWGVVAHTVLVWQQLVKHRWSRGQAPQFAEPLRDTGFSPLRWWDVWGGRGPHSILFACFTNAATSFEESAAFVLLLDRLHDIRVLRRQGHVSVV